LPKIGCSYHCSGCGSHFSSLEAFDLHRTGSFQESTRACWGEECEGKLVPKTEHGICKLGGHDERWQGVVIWQSARWVGHHPRGRSARAAASETAATPVSDPRAGKAVAA
jgi:hypothetical protein